MSRIVASERFLALTVKAKEESVLRHIFFRGHSLGLGGEEDKAKTRAIFLTGLSDQLAQQETLKSLLGQFGELQSIVVHPSQVQGYTILVLLRYSHFL